ncbi:MAG: hypothetical protein ACQESR_24870 [Planctomycetota bacterium]
MSGLDAGKALVSGRAQAGGTSTREGCGHCPKEWATRFRKPGFTGESSREAYILQAVGFVRVESGPTQAVLPLVGLATDKVIRDHL